MANILIVDDSMMMRRNLRLIMEESGHNVVAEASNGKQAFFAYATHIPDLVTLDISMPGEDGISTVKRIISKFPDAKIIMITALQQKQMVYKSLKNGAKNYIVKPIQPQKVLDTIEEVLKK